MIGGINRDAINCILCIGLGNHDNISIHRIYELNDGIRVNRSYHVKTSYLVEGLNLPDKSKGMCLDPVNGNDVSVHSIYGTPMNMELTGDI